MNGFIDEIAEIKAKQYGVALSEINDYYVPSEGKALCFGKVNSGFALKRMSREEILSMYVT